MAPSGRYDVMLEASFPIQTKDTDQKKNRTRSTVGKSKSDSILGLWPPAGIFIGKKHTRRKSLEI